MKKFLIVYLLLIFSYASAAVTDDMPFRSEVLILHSYSSDYDWTNSEQRGIESVLKKYISRIKLRIEYMDSSHSPWITKTESLRNLYREKFNNSRFRVIIATDNAALEFLRKYRDELFRGVPVVFCGINGFEMSMISGVTGFTGVAEDNDFIGLFNIIKKVQPEIRRINIYGIPGDPSHVANAANIRKVTSGYNNDLAILIKEFPHINSCIEDASRLSAGDAILMLGSMINSRGEGINLQRANELMSAAVSVPVYSAWDFALDHGAVGGYVVSGFDQGRIAAEISLRILGGEDPSSINVARNVSNRYMFDYNQLKRFGIRIDRLPEGATIYNPPESSYKIAKEMFWLGAFFVILLLIIIVVLVFNIRIRKRAEENLKKSEEKYSKAFRNIADVVGIARLRDGVWIEVSDAFFKIFGYTRDDVIGKASSGSDHDTMSSGSFPLWKNLNEKQKLFDSFMKNSFVRDLEVEWCERNGRTRTGLYSAEVISIAGEECIIYVWHDITEWINSREEKEFLEERLRQAQKMESIGMLAGGIAHDFNNLMTPILGYAEILLAGAQFADPVYYPLNQIKIAAERASELTRQLLAFGRKQMLELKVVDLGDVVRGFEHILRHTIREDITIDVRVTGNLNLVRADTGQIEQVIMNLAVNAQDAMLKGGMLVIEIGSRNFDDEFVDSLTERISGRYVVMSVSDTGSGMDSLTRDHLFEPFFTTKERGKGTGLGLSTVYGIVKQHMGLITVYSEIDKGTVFKIYLPSVDETEIKDISCEDRSLNIKSYPKGDETILLVEDNEMVLKIAREMLVMLGYEVVSADTAEMCIQLFEKHKDRIDMLLTDVIMPKMNGKELYTRLSEMKPGLKVLYMSGYTSNVIGHHGVLDEGVHLVNKPLSIHTLAEKIRSVLDG